MRDAAAESPNAPVSPPVVNRTQPTASSQKGFNKKTSYRYRLVYRSQEDPLIHDPEASTGVFVEIQKKPKRRPGNTTDDADGVEATAEEREEHFDLPRPTGPSQIKSLHDLQAEADKYEGRRENEGEAALYGIMFDDSSYDYMQHLREIGRPDAGPAVFIPAPSARTSSSRRAAGIKFKDDQENDEDDKRVLPAEVLPSKVLLRRTYQDQQDVPDAIAGLQPDMDPDLREVLEALDDEAYVEDDENVFAKVIAEDTMAEDDDDDIGQHQDQAEEGDGEDWEAEFAKFKISQSRQRAQGSDDDLDSDSLGSLVSFGRGAGKSRKSGIARTSTSGYSMSSSAMFRNEGLSLIDDRFETIEKLYNESSDDDDDESDPDFNDNTSIARTEIGSATGDERDAATMQSTTFNAIMDDFLENYNVVGKRLVREAPAIGAGVGNATRGGNGKLRMNKKSSRGLAQLREIKEELGKPQTDYIKRRYRLKD
ncbi:Low temperature viability protein-domain-containing protein [Lipomyces kononenkoae]|uniref:Low temperature viability protein-domain-containing protein n=1 Tax=Lipomyces kononenkoae TaxID=34357 RepID=A0ACC3SWV9_LIPKO